MKSDRALTDLARKKPNVDHIAAKRRSGLLRWSKEGVA
jgi:hypothetical protein